jgi:hypothetical protein
MMNPRKDERYSALFVSDANISFIISLQRPKTEGGCKTRKKVEKAHLFMR